MFRIRPRVFFFCCVVEVALTRVEPDVGTVDLTGGEVDVDVVVADATAASAAVFDFGSGISGSAWGCFRSLDFFAVGDKGVDVEIAETTAVVAAVVVVGIAFDVGIEGFAADVVEFTAAVVFFIFGVAFVVGNEGVTVDAVRTAVATFVVDDDDVEVVVVVGVVVTGSVGVVGCVTTAGPVGVVTAFLFGLDCATDSGIVVRFAPPRRGPCLRS